jgi:hypothetical protein
MKRVVVVGIVGVVALVGVVVVLLVQQTWAAFMKQPPWTTQLKLAALPAVPWVAMPANASSSILVRLPLGFRDRGPDAVYADGPNTHRPFGYGHYFTQNVLGGGTTHEPLQVDVIAVRDENLALLRGRFFNSAAFVSLGSSAPQTIEHVDGVDIETYERVADEAPGLRAVVLIDTARHLRLEVVDVLLRFSNAELRAFALEAVAAVQLGD